jgi:hypothetical protein
MTELSVQEALALQHATQATLVAAVDAGAISFMEMATAARLATPVRLGQDLTVDQCRQAWRLLMRNEPAIVSAGIRMPAPRAATRQAAVAPVRPSEPPARRRPELFINADGRIQVRDSPFALNEGLKVDAHVQWSKAGSFWHTAATPAHAAALSLVLAAHEPVLSERVAALTREFTERAERRGVLDPRNPVPEVDFGPLLRNAASVWAHQARAVEYASVSSAACLAIPMGGGKTAAAIAAANRLGAARTVIVCPNKVRGVWPHEVDKWSAATWHIVDGKRPSKRRGGRAQDLSMGARMEQAEHCLFDCACGALVHAAVFNYEMLANAPLSSWVPPIQLDMVIYDEAHRLKSPTGQVSKLAGTWVDFFRHRLALTGTPMPQYPWDIYGMYRALDPGIFGPVWTPFRRKFVVEKERKEDGRKFPVAIEPAHRAEFVRKVHSILYRPTIDLKLPPVTHQVRTVELEPKARREYDRLEEEMLAELGAFRRIADGDVDAPVNVDGGELTPRNVLARTLRMRQFTGGTVPDDGEFDEDKKLVRQFFRVSEAKSEALAEILEEVGCTAASTSGPEGGPEPVIVFAEFRADLDAIHEVARRAGLRYGEISGRRSDGLDDRSKMSADRDVVAVQIASGGTGVDLTRSCFGVWYSAGYSVGDHDQALKRQDRPGQTRPVRYVHLVAADTVDVDVYRSLATRRGVTATFLAAHGVDPRSVGLEGEDVEAAPELSMEEVAEAFMRRRAAEGGDGDRSGAVSLPIDEWAIDPMGDPRAHHVRRRVVDSATLAEYDLEGFM